MNGTQWEIIEDEAGKPVANRPKYKWVESTPGDYNQTKEGRVQTHIINKPKYLSQSPTKQQNTFCPQVNTFFVWKQYNHDSRSFIPTDPIEIVKNKSAFMSSTVGSSSIDRNHLF